MQQIPRQMGGDLGDQGNQLGGHVGTRWRSPGSGNGIPEKHLGSGYILKVEQT